MEVDSPFSSLFTQSGSSFDLFLAEPDETFTEGLHEFTIKIWFTESDNTDPDLEETATMNLINCKPDSDWIYLRADDRTATYQSTESYSDYTIFAGDYQLSIEPTQVADGRPTQAAECIARIIGW